LSRVFVDTNVLVYADDDAAPDKRDVARLRIVEWMREGRMVVSTQVLQEYFVTVTRRLAVPAEIARAKVEIYAGTEVVRITPPTILDAIDLARLHPMSFWDALVVRCASEAACETLATEDLQPGRKYGRVHVVDPFASA
jgi:predicted nucleic acid-binding protein